LIAKTAADLLLFVKHQSETLIGIAVHFYQAMRHDEEG